jgi:pimeloyl-ACP methyl ester carboxylesterase
LTGRFFEVNGQKLAVWEQVGNGTPLLFVHATGFHARVWNQVIARLINRHAIAVDMRGHGMSSKPAPPYKWVAFGEDVAALAQALKLEGAVGVGHSMGGHSLVVAAALAPGAFSKLVLLDPVILPPSYYVGGTGNSHFARKRKNVWHSPEEMFERFKDRPPFRDWDTAVLRDYCEWGLTLNGNDFVLACPPEIEASIYENASQPESNPHPFIARVDIPVLVVRGGRGPTGEITADLSASPTAVDLASRFRKGRDVVLPNSHYIPMEAPALVADIISGARFNQ